MGGFLPAVKQIANVASLPGIVGVNLNCYLCLMCSILLASPTSTRDMVSLLVASSQPNHSFQAIWLHSIWMIPRRSYLQVCFHCSIFDFKAASALISIAEFAWFVRTSKRARWLHSASRSHSLSSTTFPWALGPRFTMPPFFVVF